MKTFVLILLLVVVVCAVVLTAYGPTSFYCDAYHALTGGEAHWKTANGGGAQCYHLDDLKTYTP